MNWPTYLLFWLAGCLAAAPPDLLVVVNQNRAGSTSLGEFYARRRGVPPERLIRLRTSAAEEITREVYQREIEEPLRAALGRQEKLPKYLVLCHGVPLRIAEGGHKETTRTASVDSELAALRLRLAAGSTLGLAGPLPNPYFRAKGGEPPIFLVTRLTGFTFADARALVDRAMAARPEVTARGRIVLDQHEPGFDSPGNFWMRTAAGLFPRERVIWEQSRAVVRDVDDIIAYAGWGSNDRTRRVTLKGERNLNLRFLPGAIATEYVSTNARTFQEPPPQWRFGEWNDPTAYFRGSVQSLTGDLIRQGVTGASGHVAEPFLANTPHPDILFGAYLNEGKTLGEAFWMSIPVVSWMNVVVGDPLCKVK